MHGTFAGWVLAGVLLANQDPAATLTQEPMTALEGRVVDSRGEGIAAAKVWVVAWPELERELAYAIADGEGYFKVTKVPQRESWTVRATADGRDVAQQGTFGGPVRLLLSEAVTLRGVLRDAGGKPVVGAVVRGMARARAHDSADAFATTDEHGAFALARMPIGPVRIAAVVVGEGLYEAPLVAVQDAEVLLVHDERPSTSIELAIAGMPKELLPSVRVLMLPNRAGSMLPPPWQRPEFGNEPALTLRDLPDTDYELSLTSPTHALAPGKVLLEHGKGPHRVAFTAAPIRGEAMRCPARVRGPDGAPIAGIKLECRRSNGGASAVATSAADGTLAFASPLAKGTDVVVYSLDDRWVFDQDKHGLIGDHDRRFLPKHECKVDPTTTLELRVIPACTVTGTLLLPDGRPAAFVEVQLQESRAGRWPQWMGMAWAVTDRDGRFAFHRLHPLTDPVRVDTTSTAGSATSEPLVLADAGAHPDVGSLRLDAPAVVEGVVRDGQQRPAPGLRVWLRDWDLDKGQQRSGSVVEAVADRQGRYRFVGVPVGGAWLQLLVGYDERHTTDRVVEPFAVEAGKRYVFDLQVPAR